jgi:acetylornithine deacetylase/succinyl-diaminopimelate desuccinylase-like protein
MADQVTCIVKGDGTRYSDCRCITEIRTGTGRYSRSAANAKVSREPGSLYVQAAGSRVNVIPAEREGVKYVRTVPNDTTADNLLSVREC